MRTLFKVALGALVVLAMAVLLTAFLLAVEAWARPGGNWTEVDPEVRAWIAGVHRPDLQKQGIESSCCGIGDAYEADLGEQGADGTTWAIVTNNRGNELPVGKKLLVPADKIQNREGNPTDHVIVFAAGDQVYCYIPNGGV